MKLFTPISAICLFAIVLLASCKKDESGQPSGTVPVLEDKSFRMYTDGTFRDADSVEVSRVSGNVVIEYLSGNTLPVAFSGTLSIPDTVTEGSAYMFGTNDNLALFFVDSAMPDGYYYKSVSGTCTVSDHNLPLKRIEVIFYGMLKEYDANSVQTGHQISVSNGHAVAVYAE
jgi:hypothetical protein